jgi:hypothetical protein
VLRLVFWVSALVAIVCVVTVVVAVVGTGRDGTIADWSALLAVIALVVSWRSVPPHATRHGHWLIELVRHRPLMPLSALALTPMSG